MTVIGWYATQMLIDERKRTIERDARLGTEHHLARRARPGRRFGRSR